MNAYPVDTLQDGTRFTDKVFLDEHFLLLDSEVPFTASIKKALSDWSFTVIYSDGSSRAPGSFVAAKPEPSDDAAEQKESVKKEAAPSAEFESVDINDLLGLPAQEKPAEAELPHSPPPPPPPPMPDALSEEAETAAELAAEPVAAEEEPTPVHNTDASRMKSVKATYDDYVSYINKVYTKYATHKTLDLQDLSNTAKTLCVFIKENQRYVLRVMPSQEMLDRNFLVSHSMRSTVLAITIGLTLHLPLTKLIELGVACIVHEIGQIRLPPQLYMTDRLLSHAEKAQMATHPILSYNIVKENNFPLAIQLGVLEHHERENGTGYPRHLTADKISSYAKIISVACSFEAITAPRHFREARSTYEAMVEMLRNHDHAYDETVIKALLYSLSLFPIGAYVQLSTGSIAQVTDVNPADPKHPIVQLVGETDASGSPKTVQTDARSLRIVRVLNKQEIEGLKNRAEQH